MTNGHSVASARKLLAGAIGTVAAFVLFFGAGQGSWSIAVLGVAVLVLAISLVAVTFRGGGRGWVAGSAHVVSASEPPASSAYGRCELQLVIDAVGVPAAAVKVRDARVPVTKWPDAGATLPIMVSVDDPRRVRIQWDEVLTHAQAAVEDELAHYHDPHAVAPTGRPSDPGEAVSASALAGADVAPHATATATRPEDAIYPDTIDLARDVGSIHAQEAGPPDAETHDQPVGPPGPGPGRPRPRPTSAAATEHTVDNDGHIAEAEEPDRYVAEAEEPDERVEDAPHGGRELADPPRPRRPDPPVIITQTPDGPVVEGWVVERPEGLGSTLGGPGPADSPDIDPTTRASHTGTFPLPRRKPNPSLFREPDVRKPDDSHHTSPGPGTAGTAGTGAWATTTVHSDGDDRAAAPAAARSTDEHSTMEYAAEDDLAEPFDTGSYAPPASAGPIHGVGITVLVTDLQRSIDFYRDLLGFFEIDGGDGNAVLASGDTRLVLRTIPDVAKVNRRVVHLNLEVADVEATYQELRDKGIEFTYAPRPVNKGERLELWAAAFRDPDGHAIAITQWRNRPSG